MARQVIDLNPAQQLMLDVRGASGEHIFVLQGRAREREVTLIIDQAQASALADATHQLFDLLDKQYPRPINDLEIPYLARMSPQEPVRRMLHVAYFQLAYQAESDRAVLIAAELRRIRTLTPQDPRLVRFWVTREQLLGIARRIERILVGPGPVCPACGQPLDAKGHYCVSSN
jgi:uncharacterized repeat protein (TIGR03847 family)